VLALLSFVGDGRAVAVACDMPALTAELVRRLVVAPPAPVVAPRRNDSKRGLLWEPLFARYDSAIVLPIARRYASAVAEEGGRARLQTLLDLAGAEPLPLLEGDDRALSDWDSPEHLPRDAPRGMSRP
jgi:molybdopterin-guanine dinucleotide biosynthesis protein A